MDKYLIKNTTKMERIQLVKAWEEDEGCDTCGMNLLEYFREYIDGNKEIAEVNAEYRANYISELPDDQKPDTHCGMGMRR